MTAKKKSTTKKTTTKKSAPVPSASDVAEPQTTVAPDPEKLKGTETVPLASDPDKEGVVMADSSKSPPQPQTAYIKDKDD